MTTKTKVLLAETDHNASVSLSRELKKRGYEVIVATDASHALNAGRQHQPDVIVLSGALAGGAAAALKRIRSNVYTTSIPVIGIEMRSGAKAKELLAAGAQECLKTPAGAALVEEAIKRHELAPLDFTEAPAAVIREPARMKAVKESGLLDSPPDASFDLLTHFASRLVDAPTALISLVDADRQFFKSQVGLAQPWSGARQTRLSHSFCQWVVSGKEALRVEDAREHPVLKSNLAIRDLGVIAYAGVPLSGRGGQPIGSFCAIDSKARSWSDADMEVLRNLALITEAKAVADRMKRSETTKRAADVAAFARVSANAVLAAVRLFRANESRLEREDRHKLIAIIEEQSAFLAELAAKAANAS